MAERKYVKTEGKYVVAEMVFDQKNKQKRGAGILIGK